MEWVVYMRLPHVRRSPSYLLHWWIIGDYNDTMPCGCLTATSSTSFNYCISCFFLNSNGYLSFRKPTMLILPILPTCVQLFLILIGIYFAFMLILFGIHVFTWFLRDCSMGSRFFWVLSWLFLVTCCYAKPAWNMQIGVLPSTWLETPDIASQWLGVWYAVSFQLPMLHNETSIDGLKQRVNVFLLNACNVHELVFLLQETRVPLMSAYPRLSRHTRTFCISEDGLSWGCPKLSVKQYLCALNDSVSRRLTP